MLVLPGCRVTTNKALLTPPEAWRQITDWFHLHKNKVTWTLFKFFSYIQKWPTKSVFSKLGLFVFIWSDFVFFCVFESMWHKFTVCFLNSSSKTNSLNGLWNWRSSFFKIWEKMISCMYRLVLWIGGLWKNCNQKTLMTRHAFSIQVLNFDFFWTNRVLNHDCTVHCMMLIWS